MDESRPFWRRGLDRVQDFVADPNTKKYAQVGGKVLEVAARIGQAKLSAPVSVIGAAVGIVDVIAQMSNKSLYAQFQDIARMRSMETSESDTLIHTLHATGSFVGGEIVATLGDYSMVSIHIPNGETAVIVDRKNNELVMWMPTFVGGGALVDDVCAAIWKHYGAMVKMIIKQERFGGTVLRVEPLTAYSDLPTDGDRDPYAFVEEYRKYRAHGMSFGRVLVGAPGAGKTTFLLRVAQILGGRAMLVTPEVFNNNQIQQQDFIKLVSVFRPTMLLLDDVDSVKDDRALLSLVDLVRRTNPDGMLVATANNYSNILKSLRRPGRIGQREIWHQPTAQARLSVIRHYCNKFGIRDISHLADLMGHPEFTADYIKDIVEHAVLMDDAGLRQLIAQVVEGFGTPESPSPAAVTNTTAHSRCAPVDLSD